MDALQKLLIDIFGGQWTLRPLRASSFCATWLAQRGSSRLFVKSGDAALLDAEADGLRALAATNTIRVPHVVASASGVLALEWLELAAAETSFGERFGHALGALHAADPPMDGYGWRRDNFIGTTRQTNAVHADWIVFYGEQRLAAMQGQLARRGADRQLLDVVGDVIAALPRFFADGHTPRPSLIHGDLWSGNWGMLADGTPVIYDPAVSCSDAEAELAMMELFGAPPSGFWPAYRAAAGLHAGYAARRPLYQLYHLLNHALLFGGGYAAQALHCARALALPAR